MAYKIRHKETGLWYVPGLAKTSLTNDPAKAKLYKSLSSMPMNTDIPEKGIAIIFYKKKKLHVGDLEKCIECMERQCSRKITGIAPNTGSDFTDSPLYIIPFEYFEIVEVSE